MQDPFSQDQRPRKRRHLFLRLDSWIDSTLWSAGFSLGDKWEDLNIFFRRFTVKGYKRAFFEVTGEAMTLGTAGFVLMLALALPAFDETYGNWRQQDDFAVAFLDRYGNEIGHRGIIREDSVPVDTENVSAFPDPHLPWLHGRVYVDDAHRSRDEVHAEVRGWRLGVDDRSLAAEDTPG